jgi:protein phosphatase
MAQPQASPVRLKIDFAQASDPGRDPNKQINEDSCGYQETRWGHLCVLCDGMGGHYGGREASQLAIKTIFEVFDQAPAHLAPAVVLKGAVEEAGRRVYTLGGPPENRTRPGSTCVAVLLHDRGADVAHVGDSRAYIIRAGQIYPITRDHSMVQGMIDAGLLTEEQAVGHPDGNKITRALGMKPEVEVEVRPEPMDCFPGDIFILSSDGLTDMARNHEILGATKQALASGGLDHACATLVKFANDRGGHDNISVQMARVADLAPKVSATIPQAPSPMASPVPAAAPAPMPAAPLTETIAMTRPDTRPPAMSPVPSPIPAQAGVAAQPGAEPRMSPAPAQPAGAWGVAPTAAGVTPPVPPAPTIPHGASPTITGLASVSSGPSPTVVETGPVSEGWNSQRYPALQAPPASISQYRLDGGPAALPLPPPRPGRTLTGTHGVPVKTLQDAAIRPPAAGPTPAGISYPGGRPAQSGIIFLIIGISSVIAILLILVLWALLRD